MTVVTTVVLRIVQISYKFIHGAHLDRLPLRPFFILFSWLFVIASSRSRVPQLLVKFFSGPQKNMRIAAAIIALTNVKCLPFVWHFRVWKAILKHLLYQKPRLPPYIAPSTLFLPVITQTRSPPNECDFNLHKSNSSYYSDLDVSRAHFLCSFLEPGIYKAQRNHKHRLVHTPSGELALGSWAMVLGSCSCSFKKEIGMYQPYEIWSRLLCWDNKWIYIVTHFVKAGSARPSSYILYDETWFKQAPQLKRGKGQSNNEPTEPIIYASAISKYVAKLGRLTIHPEVILAASNLLPPKPGGWHTMAGSAQKSISCKDNKNSENNTPLPESKTDMGWEHVDELNRKGLRLAKNFLALDELNTNLPDFKGPALGKFCDFVM